MQNSCFQGGDWHLTELTQSKNPLPITAHSCFLLAPRTEFIPLQSSLSITRLLWSLEKTYLVLKSSAASLALSICTTSLAFSALVHRVWGNREAISVQERTFFCLELPTPGVGCLWGERVAHPWALGSWGSMKASGQAVGVRAGNLYGPFQCRASKNCSLS